MKPSAHNPQAILETQKIKPDIEYIEDPYQAVQHAEALLVLTDWSEYKELDYERIKNQMTSANLVDGRNMLDSKSMQHLGFNYRGIGRR